MLSRWNESECGLPRSVTLLFDSSDVIRLKLSPAYLSECKSSESVRCFSEPVAASRAMSACSNIGRTVTAKNNNPATAG